MIMLTHLCKLCSFTAWHFHSIKLGDNAGKSVSTPTSNDLSIANGG